MILCKVLRVWMLLVLSQREKIVFGYPKSCKHFTEHGRRTDFQEFLCFDGFYGNQTKRTESQAGKVHTIMICFAFKKLLTSLYNTTPNILQIVSLLASLVPLHYLFRHCSLISPAFIPSCFDEIDALSCRQRTYDPSSRTRLRQQRLRRFQEGSTPGEFS